MALRIHGSCHVHALNACIHRHAEAMVMVEMRMLPNSLADLIYVSRFVLLERRSRSELSRCSMDSRK